MLLSVSHELTLQLLQAPPSSRARVVVGYAGWGPGQLEKELAASSWLTIDVDPALIFGVPPEQMWETAIRRLGADPADAADELRRALMRATDDRFTLLHRIALLARRRAAAASRRNQPCRHRPRPTSRSRCCRSFRRWPRASRRSISPPTSSRCPRTSGRRWPSWSRPRKVFDALFLRQVWAGNEAMLLDLARDDSPLGRARLHYFLINKGPWSRLDHNEPFVPGAPPKPAQAQLLSGRRDEGGGRGVARRRCRAAERARATGFFTTIRRGPDGKFMAVPYSLEYQGELARVAALLREAAALTHAADAEDVTSRSAPPRS